jgi:hypothetical protein
MRFSAPGRITHMSMQSYEYSFQEIIYHAILYHYFFLHLIDLIYCAISTLSWPILAAIFPGYNVVWWSDYSFLTRLSTNWRFYRFSRKKTYLIWIWKKQATTVRHNLLLEQSRLGPSVDNQHNYYLSVTWWTAGQLYQQPVYAKLLLAQWTF